MSKLVGTTTNCTNENEYKTECSKRLEKPQWPTNNKNETDENQKKTELSKGLLKLKYPIVSENKCSRGRKRDLSQSSQKPAI